MAKRGSLSITTIIIIAIIGVITIITTATITTTTEIENSATEDVARPARPRCGDAICVGVIVLSLCPLQNGEDGGRCHRSPYRYSIAKLSLRRAWPGWHGYDARASRAQLLLRPPSAPRKNRTPRAGSIFG